MMCDESYTTVATPDGSHFVHRSQREMISLDSFRAWKIEGYIDGDLELGKKIIWNLSFCVSCFS